MHDIERRTADVRMERTRVRITAIYSWVPFPRDLISAVDSAGTSVAQMF